MKLFPTSSKQKCLPQTPVTLVVIIKPNRQNYLCLVYFCNKQQLVVQTQSCVYYFTSYLTLTKLSHDPLLQFTP